jgi:hypothetical protein
MSTDFAELIQKGILTLPSHLKAALRLVDDPDIPDEGRVAIAGALLHWLSGSNSIPGVRGPLQLADDVLMLRLAYEQVEKVAPEAMARHRQDEPEVFEPLAGELALMREALGKGIAVLEKALSKMPKIKHQGLTAEQCVHDEAAGTELYEEVQTALVDLELEEDEVARAVKGLGPVVEGLKARAQA